MDKKEKKPQKKQRIIAIVLAVVVLVTTLASTFASTVLAADGAKKPSATATITPKKGKEDKEEMDSEQAAIFESIMKGLSKFDYQVYEWPEKLTVGKLSFDIAEALYTMYGNKSKDKPVLWNDSTIKEEMQDFYSTTDWHKFTGMHETIEISNFCKAILTEEVKAYEELLDKAASDNGISVYKEIFKALAQARFNEHKKDYEKLKSDKKIKGKGDDPFDLFHIDGSWIDGGRTPIEEIKENSGKVKFNVQQSIDIAAKALADIIKDAAMPSPYSTDTLMGTVQSFEYGGASNSIRARYDSSSSKLSDYTGFISFEQFFETEIIKFEGSEAGKNESEKEEVDKDKIIEKYAKVISHNKQRPSSDHEVYGKYKYSDQRFYQKVFENYRCSGGGTIDYGQLPPDMADILRKCMKNWDSRVTKERREIIQQGVLLYGVTYSMDSRNAPSIEKPQFLDCSSFVGQCYWRAGILDRSAVHWCTGNFSSNFQQINESELIPGDIAQKIWNPGGSGASEHIGIYIGQIGGTKYFLHCASSSGGINGKEPGKGVRIDSYGGFKAFGRCKTL